VPIDIEIADDLADWRVEVPGKARGSSAEALTGPTSPEGTRVQVHNAPGAEVGPGQVATWATAKEDEVEAFGFKWSWPGRSCSGFVRSGPIKREVLASGVSGGRSGTVSEEYSSKTRPPGPAVLSGASRPPPLGADCEPSLAATRFPPSAAPTSRDLRKPHRARRYPCPSSGSTVSGGTVLSLSEARCPREPELSSPASVMLAVCLRPIT
jgi:hypothetical protein